MDDLEKDASRLLGPLRDFAPEPGGSVDPDKAVRTGRRRARIRQVSGPGVVVIAVVLAVVSATLLGRSVEEPGKRPVSSASFDPSRLEFRAGSAGGFTPSGYVPGSDRQRILLRPANPKGPLRGDAIVDLFPAGRWRPADGASTAAPSVHGRRAVWLQPPVLRTGASEVAWEWAPGAWAIASVKGAGTHRELAHRVAQSIERIQS